MQVPSFFAANILTLDRIVAAINEGGTAMSEAAEIAGYYAYDAATDSLDCDNDVERLTEDDFDAHLDFLSESGATFDRSAALQVAFQFQCAAVADLHSGDA